MKPLKVLKEHCKFESFNDVYILVAVARKKDHKEITNSQEIVFSEVIKTKKDIERKYNKIHALTRNYLNGKYSFYVYVTVNPRDIWKAYFLLQRHFNIALEEHFNGKNDNLPIKLKKISGLWISCLMKPTSRGSIKNFLVDLDDSSKLDEVCELLKEVTEIINIQKTKNGYHIIIKPVNRILLNNKSHKYNFEIKTDALTFIEYVEKRGCLK